MDPEFGSHITVEASLILKNVLSPPYAFVLNLGFHNFYEVQI